MPRPPSRKPDSPHYPPVTHARPASHLGPPPLTPPLTSAYATAAHSAKHGHNPAPHRQTTPTIPGAGRQRHRKKAFPQHLSATAARGTGVRSPLSPQHLNLRTSPTTPLLPQPPHRRDPTRLHGPDDGTPHLPDAAAPAPSPPHGPSDTAPTPPRPNPQAHGHHPALPLPLTFLLLKKRL